MAAYISFQPSDFYKTLLYTGTGAEHAVTGVGFQPDFSWIKCRNYGHSGNIYDSPRGATHYLVPSNNAIAVTDAQSLKSFDADGFTLGTYTAVNDSTAGREDFVAWNWKGGTTSGIATNGSTTITPSAYSFSQTAGISILKYTGTGSAGEKLAHGLGVTPTVIICKLVTPYTGDNWTSYHEPLTADKYMQLDTTAYQTDALTRWNDTAPDSVNITLGSDSSINKSAATQIAYVFAPKKGFSKFGSYAGNGNVDGTFIYTGFRPAWILVKRYDSGSEDWNMWDDKRIGYNLTGNEKLYANLSSAESTADDEIDILSNGWKWRTTNGGLNASGGSYIYMAFAEFPFVSSNSKPGVAR